MQYATGGWKRLRVKWTDNGPPNQATVATDLIRVTPFVNPAARIASARGTAAKAGTRLSATLTPTATPVKVRRVTLVRNGINVRDLVVRGRLRGKVKPTRKGQKIPASVKVLTKAVYAGRFNGTVPVTADGFGLPTGTGWLLARATRDRRTMVCLRGKQRSVKNTRFTVLGATGKALGLRASGAFPPLRPDGQSARSPSGKLAITVSMGPPKGLSKPCRALIRHLAAPKRATTR